MLRPDQCPYGQRVIGKCSRLPKPIKSVALGVAARTIDESLLYPRGAVPLKIYTGALAIRAYCQAILDKATDRPNVHQNAVMRGFYYYAAGSMFVPGRWKGIDRTSEEGCYLVDFR